MGPDQREGHVIVIIVSSFPPSCGRSLENFSLSTFLISLISCRTSSANKSEDPLIVEWDSGWFILEPGLWWLGWKNFTVFICHGLIIDHQECLDIRHFFIWNSYSYYLKILYSDFVNKQNQSHSAQRNLSLVLTFTVQRQLIVHSLTALETSLVVLRAIIVPNVAVRWQLLRPPH